MENETHSACMDYYNVVDMCSWQFIVKAIVLTLITIFIIVGNSLVITAVFLYQKLRRSISNSFIASLAVADLMLGLVVLPFSLILEIMSYWLFGTFLCQIWLVVDVWVCTASILHLCAISMDRFIAIAYPLKYPNLMTHRRCRLVCFGLWILAFIICFPSLVDWGSKQMEPSIQLDASLNSTMSTYANHTEVPPQCSVISANSLGYIIYSALGSFFIPSAVMSGFYIKIFLLARKFMKQSNKGAITCTTSENGSSLRVHRGRLPTVQGAFINPSLSHDKHRILTSTHINESNVDVSTPEEEDKPWLRYAYSEVEQTSREGSVKSRSTIDRQLISSVVPRRSSKSNLGNALNKETRAAKTVAIIVGCFILCWTPFFICYVLQGVSDIIIDKVLFNFFTWVGYINSLLNPCIYAFFSNDYRHAFKKILKCQVKSAVDRRQGVLRYLGSLYVSSSSTSRHELTYSMPRAPKLTLLNNDNYEQ